MYVNLQDLVLALDKEFITHDEAKALYRESLASQVNPEPKFNYARTATEAQCLAPINYPSNIIFKP